MWEKGETCLTNIVTAGSRHPPLGLGGQGEALTEFRRLEVPSRTGSPGDMGRWGRPPSEVGISPQIREANSSTGNTTGASLPRWTILVRAKSCCWGFTLQREADSGAPVLYSSLAFQFASCWQKKCGVQSSSPKSENTSRWGWSWETALRPEGQGVWFANSGVVINSF